MSITADADGVRRGTRDAERSIDRMSTNSRRSLGALRTAAAGAGIAVAGGLALGLKEAVEAATDAEVSQSKMQAQLKALGISYQQHAKQIDTVIQKTSQLSGLDDEKLQDSFTNIVRTTGDVNEALRLTGLAADFARGKNIDVAKAGEIVAKVAGGNTGILSRYGITLKDGATAAEALAALQQKFAGQAEAYGNTTKGSLDRMKVAGENLAETVGMVLAPHLAKAADTVATFFTEMQTGEGAGGRFVQVMTPIVGAVKDAVRWFGELPTSLKVAIGAGGALAVAFAAGGPVGLAVAALAGAAALVITNWDKIGPVVQRAVSTITSSLGLSKKDMQQFGDAMRNIGQAARWTFENVLLPVAKRVLPGLAQMFRGTFTIIGGVVKVFSGLLTGDFGKAFAGLRQMFRGQLTLLVGLVRAITAPLRSAVAAIGRAIANYFSAAWDSSRSIFRRGARFLVDALDTVTAPVRTVARTIGRAVVSGVSAIEDLPGLVRRVFNRVIGFLEDLPGRLLRLGRRFAGALTRPLEGIPGVLRGLAGGVLSAVKSVLNTGVDTVNRLIRTFNSTAGRIPGVPNVGLIGRLAAGMKTKGPMLAMIGEGGGPEYVIPTEPRYRARGIDLLMQAARDLGVARFARGGAVGAAKAKKPSRLDELNTDARRDLPYYQNELAILAPDAFAGFIRKGEIEYGPLPAKRLKRAYEKARKKTPRGQLYFLLSRGILLADRFIGATGAQNRAGQDYRKLELLQARIEFLNELRSVKDDIARLSAPVAPSIDVNDYLTPAERISLETLDARLGYEQADPNLDAGTEESIRAELYGKYLGVLKRLRERGNVPQAVLNEIASRAASFRAQPAPDPEPVTTDPGPADPGPGDPEPTPSPTPDQSALINQANLRTAVAQRAAALSGNFISTAFSSGDIGSGTYRNAFGAGLNIQFNMLHPGDPRLLQAIAEAATAGFGLQGAISATATSTGI